MYYVYILTNKTKTTLYVGVTNDLVRRVWEHKTKVVDSFTKRYHISELVYYEQYFDIYSAIEREKRLKGKLRSKKYELIKEFNPEMKDLFEDILNQEYR